MAILIGAFPTDTLARLIRRLVLKKVGQEDTSKDNRNRLESLQNIDAAAADRLGEEGLTTISQLAFSDPVDVTIRSGLPFLFVVDSINQALAWIYLEDYFAIARAQSLRGALEIAGFLHNLDQAKSNSKEDKETRDTAKKLLASMAKHAKLDDPTPIEECLRMMWGDKSVDFLDALYEYLRAPNTTSST